MRNRCIVAFETAASESFNLATRAVEPVPAPVEQFGGYLYWYGGPESGWAFLGALTERQRDRGGDIAYGVVGFTTAETKLLAARPNADAQRTQVERSPGYGGMYVVGWPSIRFAAVGRFGGRNYDVTTPARWLTPEAISRGKASAREPAYLTVAETLPAAFAGAPVVQAVEQNGRSG